MQRMAVSMAEFKQDITLEQGECPFVVEITTLEGVSVFRGTVSQKGDFIHLNRYPHGSVATLRVHDILAAAKKEQEPVKLQSLIQTDIA